MILDRHHRESEYAGIVRASISGLLSTFFQKAAADPRIGPNHISIYSALMVFWIARNFETPLQVFARDIMPLCKISGSATYHRTIRSLHEWGYIRYEVSYNRFEGSLIYFS